MKRYILILVAAFLISCSATTSLPTAGTMTTGEVTSTPRQYQEFCERDTDNICPEEESEPDPND